MTRKALASKRLRKGLPKITRGEPVETVAGFPVKHYSHSALVKFSTNPIMFKINYINRDRIESTQNVSGVIGTAFHKAMEVYYRGNQEMLPKDDAEAVEFGLKMGMGFLNEYNDGFIEYSESVENKQKAFDLFSFLFASYVKEKPFDPTEVIVATEEMIEETINIEWRGHKLVLPVPLKGYIDKIVRHDGKLKIKDYKTCSKFSPEEKIDGAKIIQAVVYYLLVYAKYGEEPYSFTYEEVKMTKNKDNGPQVREYEIVYAEHELYFDFFFRFYEDVTNALNGQMVYVPNIHTFFDNEVSIIAYIHRLDVPEKQAEQMKKLKVDNITDLLKAKIQTAGSMRKLMKSIEQKFVSAKNLNYEAMTNENKIQTKLLEHGMMLSHDSTIQGATVDLYRYTPSIGLKMSRIENYVADVEQVLGTSGIRVLAPIRGSTLIGFEVPRKERSFPKRPESRGFELAIGQTITGETKYFDIRTAPHMLVAGATGAGKSVFLSSIIEQLAKIPNVELHLYDPKMVELSMFEHLAKDYAHDHEEINVSLEKLVKEMNKRYKKMQTAKVRNIEDMPGMPYKFVVIDEFGDLMLSEDVQNNVLLLAQKARAAGIHLIIATQRPSVDVIKGTIKANFPIKAVFRTAKAVDSRVVLDEIGAEKLLGRGDMLFSTHDGIERLQGFC